MPSGFFSGKYVLAVRCNTDLLECIGDTFGSKMFGFRIMVRNKIKIDPCARRVVRAPSPNKGKGAFEEVIVASEEDFYPVMLLFVRNRTNLSATLKVRLRNRLSGLDNF